MNPDVISHINNRSKELFEKVVQYREHIHKNPELSFKEHKTMDYVSLSAVLLQAVKEQQQQIDNLK